MIIASEVKCDHKVGDPEVDFESSKCPRCRGKGVYYAFSMSPAGRIEFLTGFDALTFQIKKILTEARRPSGYGFDYRVLNPQQSSGDPITAITSEIYRVMQYFMNLQRQSKSEGYNYLPTEELVSVDSVRVTRSTTDPRQVYITIYVTTRSGQTNAVTQTLIG